MTKPFTCPVIVILWTFSFSHVGLADDTKGVEFFETHIRPVLVDRCYSCHSADSKPIEGDLELDSSAGLTKGGSSGPIVNLKDVDASLLLRAIRHDDGVEAMPPESDRRLSKETVAAFREWIAMGAPDPRNAEAATAHEVDWKQRQKHWAFQPPAIKPAPNVEQADWPRDAIDRWVLAQLESQGLQTQQGCLASHVDSTAVFRPHRITADSRCRQFVYH